MHPFYPAATSLSGVRFLGDDSGDHRWSPESSPRSAADNPDGGRIKWVHPDCGFWMNKRSIADRKMEALVNGGICFWEVGACLHPSLSRLDSLARTGAVPEEIHAHHGRHRDTESNPTNQDFW